MMLDLLFSLVLLICLLAVSRSATISEMTPDVYTDLSYSSCVNQGYSYYDSPSQTCVTCGTGFSPNRNLTDALGDYVECEFKIFDDKKPSKFNLVNQKIKFIAPNFGERINDIGVKKVYKEIKKFI